MSIHYPLAYTLEDGVHVIVNKAGNDTYDFTLSGESSGDRHLTFVDDNRSKDEKIESLDFDQLNAVRAFWLKIHTAV